MTLTDVERATLVLALETLERDPDADLPSRTISQIVGAGRIAERRAQLVAENQQARSLAALLSGQAQDYWTDALRVLSYGRLVHSMGSRAAERTLALKCEALEEGFEARVPAAQRGMFLIYDHADLSGASWDDRWHACQDFYFPLLRSEFCGGFSLHADLLREAQLSILTEALTRDQPRQENVAVSASGNHRQLIELARRDR